MRNFEFTSPTKIFFGKDEELKIGQYLKNSNYHKVLFHYGSGSIKKSGLYDRLIKCLTDSNIEIVELGGVVANPKIDLVRQGVKIAKEEQIDAIIACGGGSVIDSAKLIGVAALSNVDPWEYSLGHEAVTSTLPVIVILTISAAGSELSNSCVISNPVTNLKRGFNSDLIRPKAAFMNPELTYSVSPYQTACGITDILMHTIERFLVEEASPLTKEIGASLIKTVMEAGLVVMKNPTDYEARATLMLASSFSHNGLTGLGLPMYFTVHKLEHELSGFYDFVAHGAGLAVLYPAWASYVVDKHPKLFAKLATLALGVKTSGNDLNDAKAGIAKLKAFFKVIGMPVSLSELNILDPLIEPMALSATTQGTKLVLGIENLSVQDIIKIYEIAK